MVISFITLSSTIHGFNEIYTIIFNDICMVTTKSPTLPFPLTFYGFNIQVDHSWIEPSLNYSPQLFMVKTKQSVGANRPLKIT